MRGLHSDRPRRCARATIRYGHAADGYVGPFGGGGGREFVPGFQNLHTKRLFVPTAPRMTLRRGVFSSFFVAHRAALKHMFVTAEHRRRLLRWISSPARLTTPPYPPCTSNIGHFVCVVPLLNLCLQGGDDVFPSSTLRWFAREQNRST